MRPRHHRPLEAALITTGIAVAMLTSTVPVTPLGGIAPAAADPAAVDCRAHRSPRFDIILGSTEERGNWWVAQYCRELPFDTGTGWLDGDRSGYRCAYMFLEHDGVIVGRVLFSRIEGAAYAGVNDKYMDEGVRWYDGTPSNGARRELGDCPAPAEKYQTLSDPKDERPTMTFGGKQVLEVRDYKRTASQAISEGRVRFRQHQVITTPFRDAGPKSRPHTVYSRVAMVVYVPVNRSWAPAMVVYYDSLHPDVAVNTDMR